MTAEGHALQIIARAIDRYGPDKTAVTAAVLAALLSPEGRPTMRVLILRAQKEAARQ